MLGEQERCPDAPVVQSAPPQCLVHVEVHATTAAVMQDEVPGTVTRPRVDPIDSEAGERREKALKVAGTNPEIQIGMPASLCAHERVHRPASANAGIDSVLLQRGQQRAGCFRRHDEIGHDSASQAGATALLRDDGYPARGRDQCGGKLRHFAAQWNDWICR